jgi:hypothetical protein
MARDPSDFSETTKRALAFRANHQCSICRIPTSGPSDVSPRKYVNLGEAAHIHGARPGSARYIEETTPEARSDIENGIWLCRTHAKYVDNDPVAYPAGALRKIKADHEEGIKREQVGRAKEAGLSSDFIAVGPNTVFSGEVIGVSGQDWRVRVDHFLIGDLNTLGALSEAFDRTDPYDRFVLINAQGDGRELEAAPVWEKTDSQYVVSLRVKQGAPRMNAHQLPADLRLTEDHDLPNDGGSPTISGLASLPQKIKTTLSLQRGELFRHPSFGSRIAEYADLFRDTPLLPRLIRLEVIRMASIPCPDPLNPPGITPLRSVLRVYRVEQLAARAKEPWVPFRFHLDVAGVGEWTCDISIHIGRCREA